MNRADLNIEVGDCVKVREGVGDPDSDVDISGWQGRVLEIAEDESGRPLILVAWDSFQPRSEAARPLRLVLHLSRPTVVRTRS
jgi:hypothetical protein